MPLPPRTIDVEKITLSKYEQDVYGHIYARAKRVFNTEAEKGNLLKSYTTIFAQILRLRQSCCHPVLTRSTDAVADEQDAALASDLANGLADDMDLQSLIDRFTAEEEEDVNENKAAIQLHQLLDLQWFIDVNVDKETSDSEEEVYYDADDQSSDVGDRDPESDEQEERSEA